jgi:hypothetical protein
MSLSKANRHVQSKNPIPMSRPTSLREFPLRFCRAEIGRLRGSGRARPSVVPPEALNDAGFSPCGAKLIAPQPSISGGAMPTTIRRHQNDTKTFEELTAKEQALAVNAHTVWYLKAARAHGSKIGLTKATEKIARQLERMAAQVRNLT